MAPRTFHLVDGGSDKFWSIELSGASHEVHFGRAGTAGRRQVKSFASEAEAAKSHDKLVRDKLAKGYVEGSPGEPAAEEEEVLPPAWREALRLFGVDDDEIDSLAQETIEENSHTDPDADWIFSYVVTNSPCGIYTDWRGEQEDSLQHLADAMGGMGVDVELDAQDITRLEVAITSDGQARYYSRAMPEEWENFHGLVFALAEVLPPTVAIYLLTTYDDCDGWGHAVLPAEGWRRVRELVGTPAFNRLFSRHPASRSRFVPSRRKRLTTWQEWVDAEVPGRKAFLKSCAKEYREKQNNVLWVVTRQNDPKLWKRPSWETPQQHRAFLDSFRTPARLDHARSPLERIGFLRVTRGAVQVLEGDPKGWAEYHAGLRTYYWGARLDDWAVRTLHPKQTVGPRDLGEFLAGCLALGEWEMARGVFRLALAGKTDTGGITSPIVPLTLRLCALLEGVPFSRLPTTAPLGPYRPIFDAWKKPAALAQALTQACDYHVQQARRPAHNEFRFFPISVAPMEILAVLRTRRQLGLPIPDVQHPILDTPIGRPPEVVPTVPDDLLDQLIQAIEEELPGT
jgi:predicted DNA-binding WGR domain protein